MSSANEHKRSSTGGEATNTDRMRTASLKAREAFSAVSRRARRLSEELDEITMTGVPGAPSVELHDEDSAVIVVREMIGSLAKVAT